MYYISKELNKNTSRSQGKRRLRIACVEWEGNIVICASA